MSSVILGSSPSEWKAIETAEGFMLAGGKTVPSGSAGYAPGCIFIHSDGTPPNDVLFCNTGSKTSCTFTAVAAGLSPTLTAPTFSTSGTSAMLATTAGAAAAAAAVRIGDAGSKGLEIKVIDEDVAAEAAADADLTEDVPSGAVILSVQANLETTITASTAVKVGIGVAADPDKYGLSADLVQNTKVNTIPDWAVLGSAEDVQIYACDTNGDAAGTLDTGTVRVRIVYLANLALADA